MIDEQKTTSPRWSTTTKLVVALTIAAIVMALFAQFRNFVGPLIAALVLAYLVHPVANLLYHKLRFPWGLAVGLVFLLILAVMLGLATWGGFTLVDQVSSLITFLQNAITGLPALIESIISQPLQVGPFELDLTRLDLQEVTNQVLGFAQTLLARIGSLVTNVASGAASTIGWFLFTLLIAYFILAETRGRTNELIVISIPGYQEDMDRMGQNLGAIWSAFLRGQLIIIALTILWYTLLLGILGVRYYFGLALVAGLARFIPYIGPLIAWVTYGLVSYFQGNTIFGLSPVAYAGLVVGVAWLSDIIMDNLVSPRILSNVLRVHPAAVMVAALAGASLLGITAMILAAPVLASIKLVAGYIMRKLTDQDPWEGMEVVAPRPAQNSTFGWLRRNVPRIPEVTRKFAQDAVIWIRTTVPRLPELTRQAWRRWRARLVEMRKPKESR